MSEILAPAGSLESVYAAVRCGADAVYLAGEAFNARRNAENFTYEQLKQAVEYCHGRGVKVYHALNTLVKDSEIDALKEEIERILALGEDALILQDLGVAAVVKKMCPEMPLHASTQLTAHSLSGVKELERLGFKRVVLAREMSLEEIEHIRKNTSLEIEIFVHGALCMCVSGQCYLSAFLGSRSGNRGLCAQPCRLPFSAPGGTGYDLSLKDNSILEYLPKLESIGIDSFKIEGRMKRPEYVAASVSACKSALEGKYTKEKKNELKSIFSRQGFTDGYFKAELGRAMFGSRTKDDVTAAASSLLKQYSALYSKEIGRVPCSIKAVLRENEFPTFEISALGEAVLVTGAKKPEKAINRALNEEELLDRLSKLGGTQFYVKSSDIELDEGLMLSAGEINVLRREGVEKLNRKLSAIKPYKSVPFNEEPKRRKPKEKKVYLRFSSLKQTDGLKDEFDKIILPIEESKEAVEKFGTEKLILETPRVFFGLEENLCALLEKAKSLGVKEISCGNIASLYLARKTGFKVFAGFGTNVFNSYAAEEIDADEILLSAEMTSAQINHLCSQKPFGNIIYGFIPLMITRNCPLKNGRKCEKCDKKGFITDRKGEKFKVRCRFGASEIFNPYALYMIDRESEINSDFSLLYFTTETADEIKHILRLFNSKSKADFKFTRGLYAKGVL